MRIELRNPKASTSDQPPTAPAKRRSLFGRVVHGTGWLASGPVDWIGVRRIRRSWSLIGDLASVVRSGPSRDPSLRRRTDGIFDLRATAAALDISVEELEGRLGARRVQTARIAYVSMALGCLFLLAWVWQAIGSPMTATRVASALYFLPFCGLFFLYAAYQSLLNFQIRVNRAVSMLEYLSTTESFWPC